MISYIIYQGHIYDIIYPGHDIIYDITNYDIIYDIITRDVANSRRREHLSDIIKTMISYMMISSMIS